MSEEDNKQSLVGFQTQDHKILIEELESKMINAQQIIKNDKSEDIAEIVSRTFSKYFVYFNYEVYYIEDRIIWYQGRHDAHYRVEQDLYEEQKTSRSFWAEEQENKNALQIRDGFQSWAINLNKLKIVTLYADVRVGSLEWKVDPDYLEDNTNRRGNRNRRPTRNRRQISEELRKVFVELGYLRGYYPPYITEVELNEETTTYESKNSKSVTIILPDRVWGVQGAQIPDGMEAYMQSNDGERKKIDGNKRINIGNKIHLTREPDITDTLIINFYGDKTSPYVEFSDSEHIGWEHHNIDDITNESGYYKDSFLKDPTPPNGSYNYKFPKTTSSINKSGWNTKLIKAQIRDNDLDEPVVNSLIDNFIDRKEEELERENNRIQEENEEIEELNEMIRAQNENLPEAEKRPLMELKELKTVEEELPKWKEEFEELETNELSYEVRDWQDEIEESRPPNTYS